MELRPVHGNAPEIALIDEVNKEAFPPGEFMATELQARLCGEGRLELLAVYDGENFAGFTTVFPARRLAYVFFLAIHPSMRSKGYGARVLELIRERYPDRMVVLDIEPLEEGGEDYAIRLRRKQFYLRNGFLESGYHLKYLGLKFEILYAAPGTFDLDEYRSMMMEIRAMIHGCGFGNFIPEISPVP